MFCPTMVVIVDLFLRRANAVRPYRFVAVILSDIYIQFSSCVRGATLDIMPLVAYTQNTAMHTHALTQVLYSLFQKLTSVSLSRRACTCPQVSKRFLLIPKSTTFVAWKMQQLQKCCQIKYKIICLHKFSCQNLCSYHTKLLQKY